MFEEVFYSSADTYSVQGTSARRSRCYAKQADETSLFNNLELS